MRYFIFFLSLFSSTMTLNFARGQTSENALKTQATQTAPAPQSVTVHTLAKPVDKSYRKMVKGMELFEKMHAMAPLASLRFRLLPRERGLDMNGVTVRVVGDTKSYQVPIAADQSFTLDREQWALDEDASVITNHRVDSMTWRTDIRTPGLPPNTRRLGDLRLECQVGREANLLSPKPLLIDAAAKVIFSMIDICDGIETRYLLFADRPIFSVKMIFGTRTKTIDFDDLYAGISYHGVSKLAMSYCDCQAILDRTYYLPLGDHSWPDDTLIEFDFMEPSLVIQAGDKP